MDFQPTDGPRIVELTPQPAVAARMRQPLAETDLGQLFDLHLPNVAHRIADLGGEPAGAPFGRYHEFGPADVDVEIGIPVRAPVANLRPIAEAEPGEPAASELPGGRAAVAVHRGPYDGLPQAYERLEQWIAAQGEVPGAGPWESYLDDPGEVQDPSQLRTEIVWPLG
ncbi:MAG TPA: GyrI-like domain-containing protein [candidate division Zixibacteria bacterium]|nr:GyrI-like domain-containing protein [candidate division Zixibacteria bacterium]